MSREMEKKSPWHRIASQYCSGILSTELKRKRQWHEKQYCTAGQKLLTKSTLSGKKPDRWVLCRSSISSLQMHQRLSIGVRISSAYGECIRWVWCRGAIPLHHFDIASLLSSSSPPPSQGVRTHQVSISKSPQCPTHQVNFLFLFWDLWCVHTHTISCKENVTEKPTTSWP